MKWVDALRTLGATASFTADEVAVGFRLGTDGGELSDEDLPMATGDESPSVLDLPNEIGVGLRDPAQVFSFGESAAQAVNPRGYSDYQTAKATIERRLGIDIDDDLIGQLEGDASLSISTQGAVAARIQLADEAAFKRTLSKLEKELPEILSGSSGSTTRLTKAGDFSVLRSSDGDTVAYAVVDGSLVISNRLARAQQVARQEPEPVAGAKGALAMKADAQQLFLQALRSQGTALPGGGIGQALGGQLIAGPLDELTGSATTSKDGITGRLRLTFDD